MTDHWYCHQCGAIDSAEATVTAKWCAVAQRFVVEEPLQIQDEVTCGECGSAVESMEWGEIPSHVRREAALHDKYDL